MYPVQCYPLFLAPVYFQEVIDAVCLQTEIRLFFVENYGEHAAFIISMAKSVLTSVKNPHLLEKNAKSTLNHSPGPE